MADRNAAEPVAPVAVLAGGAGRRLGGAKATASLHGRPLISYPLAAAERAGLDAVVLTKRDSPLPDGLACTVVIEPDLPRHPLCGIVAALEHACGPVLAVGCDMPFLPPRLLAWMAALPGAAVASPGGRTQPLLARWLPEQLPLLGEAMEANAAMRDVVRRLSAATVDERELSRFGDPELICTSVNDAAGLTEARRLLAAR